MTPLPTMQRYHTIKPISTLKREYFFSPWSARHASLRCMAQLCARVGDVSTRLAWARRGADPPGLSSCRWSDDGGCNTGRRAVVEVFLGEKLLQDQATVQTLITVHSTPSEPPRSFAQRYVIARRGCARNDASQIRASGWPESYFPAMPIGFQFPGSTFRSAAGQEQPGPALP